LSSLASFSESEQRLIEMAALGGNRVQQFKFLAPPRPRKPRRLNPDDPFALLFDQVGESIPRTVIEVQGETVCLRDVGRGTNGGGGIRGKVNRFSRWSRKRLFDRLHRLELKEYFAAGHIAVLVTLTYARDFPCARKAKDKHLRRFEARLLYRFPEVAGFWRLEPQERGAPHFHLLLFFLPYLDKLELCRMWMECIAEYLDEERLAAVRAGGAIPERLRVFTRIEAVRSANAVIGYVGKYMAKPGDASGFNSSAYLQKVEAWQARRADKRKEAGERLRELLGDGLYEALHPLWETIEETAAASEEKPVPAEDATCGRLWGVLNKKALPVAPRVAFSFPATNKACRLRRWARRLRGGRGPRHGRAFTLYVKEPAQWLALAVLEFGEPLRIYGNASALWDSS
jgi:hypothetical protein